MRENLLDDDRVFDACEGLPSERSECRGHDPDRAATGMASLDVDAKYSLEATTLRFTRGFGTRAASRARSSRGWKMTCVDLSRASARRSSPRRPAQSGMKGYPEARSDEQEQE
jgi:hypothetical protein